MALTNAWNWKEPRSCGLCLQVLLTDDARFEHGLAEPLARLLAGLLRRRSYTHVLAPSSSFGRGILPTAAALLGVQPLSDITGVVDADTFVRCCSCHKSCIAGLSYW